VDFEGCSDGRSIKMILQHVSPRKMILIHGSNEAKEHLRKHCERMVKTCKMVLVPHLNQLLDVTSDTTIYKLKLKESFVDKLTFKPIGKYEIAYVDGEVISPEEATLNSNASATPNHFPGGRVLTKLEPAGTATPLVTTATAIAPPIVIPMLDVVPSNRPKIARNSVFIGEVKLSDFKQALATAGYKSEFYGGQLLTCDGTISLKRKEKSGHSRIKIEGLISDDYFKIRDLLYSQYTII